MKKSALRIMTFMLALLVLSAAAATLTACGEKDDTERLDGIITITVNITHADGTKNAIVVPTDCKYLSDALVEAEVVEGETSAYGFMITKVDGEEANYDRDGAYWSIEKDGAAIMTLASATEIANGEVYALVYTKG